MSTKKHTLPNGETVTIKRVGWNGVKVGQQLLTLRGDMDTPKDVVEVDERLSRDGLFAYAYEVTFSDGSRIVRKTGERRSMWRIARGIYYCGGRVRSSRSKAAAAV